MLAKWKAANRPRDPDNPTYQDMKECRKTLRSMQRQHEAQLRYNRYEEIMELQQNNNSGFYSTVVAISSIETFFKVSWLSFV
jgi:replicative DNA helicase